jgi:hypothetical protein
MQSLWNRHERRVNAVQSPWKLRGVVMQTLSYRHKRCVIAVQSSCNKKWITFFSEHGIMKCNCSAGIDEPDRRENAALVWQGFYTQVSAAMPRNTMKVWLPMYVLSIAHSGIHEWRIVSLLQRFKIIIFVVRFFVKRATCHGTLFCRTRYDLYNQLHVWQICGNIPPTSNTDNKSSVPTMKNHRR